MNEWRNKHSYKPKKKHQIQNSSDSIKLKPVYFTLHEAQRNHEDYHRIKLQIREITSMQAKNQNSAEKVRVLLNLRSESAEGW